jgi:hypothetical protein
LLTCYLDEAGGERQLFTVVGGWISTVALWDQFEIDWKLMLASYKVPYLHMKEFSQSKGPFAKWKGSEGIRAKCLGDAADIIRQRVQCSVLCYVHQQLFEITNRHYMLRETLFSPYAIAGRVCVAQVELWRSKETVPSDVEFVFEDGGPDKGGLLAAMKISRTMPEPIFRRSRDITDKQGDVSKGVVQLQAADLLAYELRKHRREFADRTGRPARRSFHEILKVPVMAMASFNEQNAVPLCQIEDLPRRS